MLMDKTDKAALFLTLGLYMLGISFNCATLLNMAGGMSVGIGIAYVRASIWEIKAIKKREKQLDEHMEFIKKHQTSCTFRTNMPD